jgi:hypothetical protein
MNCFFIRAGFSRFRRPVKQSGGICRVQRAQKWPTSFGALVVLILLAILSIWLWVYGEAFLSLTHRLPAEVLVVEGWIGNEGLRAAATEFERGGYYYIATTGGQTKDRQGPSNYAEIAAKELILLGLPENRIIIAPTGEIEHERTFNSAVAARRALNRRGIEPKAINVFTMGPHARRTRLVYAKVFASGADIGVVAWTPSNYKSEPWWWSISRTKCYLKEIVGYPVEVLLNGGRISNSPA